MEPNDWKPPKPLPEIGSDVLCLYPNGPARRTHFLGTDACQLIAWQPWADPPAPDPFDTWMHRNCEMELLTRTDQARLRGCWNAALAHAASEEQGISETELREFQDEVRSLVIKLSGAPGEAIDGKGSDAGWQEFTLAEIAQGFAYLKDAHAAATDPFIEWHRTADTGCESFEQQRKAWNAALAYAATADRPWKWKDHRDWRSDYGYGCNPLSRPSILEPTTEEAFNAARERKEA